MRHGLGSALRVSFWMLYPDIIQVGRITLDVPPEKVFR